MSVASTRPAGAVSDAAVEAVRDAVRLQDALTLHGTTAVRLAARRRVRVRTETVEEALAAVTRVRLDAAAHAVGGGSA